MANKQLSTSLFYFKGHVQGVGMRPLLFRLASEVNLKGEIFNCNSGSAAWLEGNQQDLATFEQRLKSLPDGPLSITEITVEPSEWQGFGNLKILLKDSPKGSVNLSTPPDLITCEKCWSDFFDPKSRYFKYPFVSCTECGPRWSVIQRLPFERNNTSYANFPLCEECQKIYNDPSDRRFFAQTLSCLACGPKLNLRAGQSNLCDPITSAQEFLSHGKIGILKGLGGYQLLGDGLNPEIINKIRLLKSRPHQSFAVMFRDREVFRSYGGNSGDWQTMTSSAGPIVSIIGLDIPTQKQLAPDSIEIGAMAPTTPLHWLLMQRLEVLLVTSANLNGMPIPKCTEELDPQIIKETDFILSHNRKINFAVDDSVIRNGIVYRAARGFRPAIEFTSGDLDASLALGSDIKCSAALQTHGQRLQLPYLGSLSNFAAVPKLRKRLKEQTDLFAIETKQTYGDFHPTSSTRDLSPLSDKTIFTPVPHHYAHAWSVADTDDLVLTFDGTGLNGEDIINGGEAYYCDGNDLKHVLQMKPFPIVGGESAIRQPWKLAVSALTKAGCSQEDLFALFPSQDKESLNVIRQMTQSKNVLQTSSLGRWFDAASAIIDFGIREQTYEAQAPIRLEQMGLSWRGNQKYNLDFDSLITNENDLVTFDCIGLLLEISKLKIIAHLPVEELAWLAHAMIARVIANSVKFWADQNKFFGKIKASGGVFQNRLFTELLGSEMKILNLPWQKPGPDPVNDQCIARGQLRYMQNMKRKIISHA